MILDNIRKKRQSSRIDEILNKKREREREIIGERDTYTKH